MHFTQENRKIKGFITLSTRAQRGSTFSLFNVFCRGKHRPTYQS